LAHDGHDGTISTAPPPIYFAGMGDVPFRADLAQLVRQLLDESQREAAPIGAAIREHAGGDVDQPPVHGEPHGWLHADEVTSGP
jgi:hypothetical protein